MNIKFLAIAITASTLTVAFTKAVDTTALKGTSMNRRGVNDITLTNSKTLNGLKLDNGVELNGLKAENGRLKNGNEINAFTVRHGTVNGAKLQSIKVEGGQLVGIQRR